MNSQKIPQTIFFTLCLVISSCGSSENEIFTPGDDLTLTSIEMSEQYGESTLIQYRDYDILIDSGTSNDASHVNEVLLEKVSDRTIDLLIVTHPHGDHIGGIINGALSGFSIETIVDYGYSFQTNDEGKIENHTYVDSYINWRTDNIQNGTTYYQITSALANLKTINISQEDDLFLKWLNNDNYLSENESFPNSKIPTDNPNTTSVSCYIQYKYWRIVLCGDIESSFAELSIVNNHPNLFKEQHRTILKANHHASSSSLGSNFLDWVSPEVVFTSSAMIDQIAVPNQVALGSGSGQQDHPNKSTVKRIKNRTEQVYWNAINGDVTLTIDGVNDCQMSGKGRSKNYYTTEGIEASVEQEKNVTFFNSEFYQHFLNR